MDCISRISALLIVLLVLVLSVGISFGEPEALDFLLQEYLSGKTKSFKDILSAKVNVLLVTETNCYSCIKELQSLDMIRAKYRGDLSVSAAFLDRDGYSKVKRYADYYKFDIDNILIDETSSVAQGLRVTYVPTMVIFDKKGNIAHRRQGFADGDESAIIAAVDEVLFPSRARVASAREDNTPSGATPATSPEPTPRKATGCASTP